MGRVPSVGLPESSRRAERWLTGTYDRLQSPQSGPSGTKTDIAGRMAAFGRVVQAYVGFGKKRHRQVIAESCSLNHRVGHFEVDDRGHSSPLPTGPREVPSRRQAQF